MNVRRILGLTGFYGAILLIGRLGGDRAPDRAPVAYAATSAARSGSGTAIGSPTSDRDGTDRAPGMREEHGTDIAAGLSTYGIGLALALLLTGASFFVAGGGSFVWRPAVPIALVVLAVAQIGVHLVFFLHLTTGPDNTNNVLALAFGTLIVILILAGTLWIMANLNHNMMPMHDMMRTQR